MSQFPNTATCGKETPKGENKHQEDILDLFDCYYGSSCCVSAALDELIEAEQNDLSVDSSTVHAVWICAGVDRIKPFYEKYYHTREKAEELFERQGLRLSGLKQAELELKAQFDVLIAKVEKFGLSFMVNNLSIALDKVKSNVARRDMAWAHAIVSCLYATHLNLKIQSLNAESL
jgi:hypothetical protein